MGTYERKEDVPENIRQYLENVSQETFDDMDLHTVNDYLFHLEDWVNEQEEKDKN